ncbi:MAG: ethanolamine utilization protein EutJ [Tissierellales bacterium]|jgi:ethanolamine utilization protein EutJ|nr:ethanolamine utilization protein EutJ [Tissierellales bacterium]HCX05099.1 ethanolamine utilization protein EutJ [Clostridiales bacterium]
MDLTIANKNTEEFSNLIKSKERNTAEGDLKIGVDLGTANIVIAVVDQNNKPIAGVIREANVVRDGIVVDYINATRIVKELKIELEKILGFKISKTATAIPPGIIEGNTKVIKNVVKAAGFEISKVVDEPTAAAIFLGINDGAVVDVGGGTTGISILRNKKVIYTTDEATGGMHMSLVIAGAYKITLEDAEIIKKDINKESENFVIIEPVVEKMASIVKKAINNYEVKKVYIVGGACTFKRFCEVFYKELKIDVIKPANPLLVTPLGIAMCSNN